MDTTTITQDYRIEIPLQLRESLGIKPGQKVQIIPYGDRIEIIPVRELREMRGYLRGLDSSIERDPDRV